MPVTMQALSEEDRNQWLEVLDGKEAVRTINFFLLKIIAKDWNCTGLSSVVFALNFMPVYQLMC